MTPKQAMEAGLAKASLEVEPGLEPPEIDLFERELPGKLPSEIRELLAFTGGLKSELGAVEVLDFRGGTGGFEYEPAFPRCVPVASDGAGNFWVVDVHPETGSWGTVFYACHDPPVIAIQARSLADFIEQVFAPGQSLLVQVHDGAVTKIWRGDPFLLPSDEPGFRIADLRKSEIGTGFSWGRHGRKTRVRRQGQEQVFMVEHRGR